MRTMLGEVELEASPLSEALQTAMKTRPSALMVTKHGAEGYPSPRKWTGGPDGRTAYDSNQKSIIDLTRSA